MVTCGEDASSPTRERRGYLYRNSVVDGFDCLSNLGPNYVDYRYWGDSDLFFTAWRIPYTQSSLQAHVDFFGLENCEATQEIAEALNTNLPSDWDVELDDEIVFYKQTGVTEISYFCRLLLFDPIEGIIYFYDMDQSVPA